MFKRIMLMAGVFFFVMTPSAQALTIDVGSINIQVLDPDPTPALVALDADNDSLDLEVLTFDGDETNDLEVAVVLLDVDLLVLPVLVDPLVHVCVGGVVQTVLASVAANLHLDVLGADEGCAPVTTTPPTNDDPLVHVCVSGVVQSVLASVAANLHLDILGSDDDCSPTTTTPPSTNDPLVHVCVNGTVQSFLASVALNLHLDVLGSDEKCPPPSTTTPPTTPTAPSTPSTPTQPTVTVAATDTGVVAAGSTKDKGGSLAFTGSWAMLLALLAAGLTSVGLIVRRIAQRG